MDQPILLLKKNPDGKWFVTQEAERQLESMDMLIGVISIAGKYNSGKSFLMNHLFDIKPNDGFSVGQSHNATTKGIWMYALPNQKDPRKWVVVLDSEGLDDVMMGDQNHDMDVFILVLLISHCFMFNNSGSVGSGMIESLRLVSELAQRIKVREHGDVSDANTYFGQHFPHLFLILRDMNRKLLDESGQEETADQYFERILSLRPESDSNENYNAPRVSIRNFFPNRNCHTLPTPCDINELSHLDSLQTDQLSKRFIDDLKKIQDAVNTVAKARAEEKGINGKALLHIIKQYVEMINDESNVPCIDTAYNMAAREVCQKAKEEAFVYYKERMDSALVSEDPVSNTELVRFHDDSRTSAFATYTQNAWYGKGETERMKLQVKITEALTSYQEQNDEKWRKFWRRQLNVHFCEIRRDYSMGRFTSEECLSRFEEAKTMAISNYNEGGENGPFQKEELNNFLKETINNIESCVRQYQMDHEHRNASHGQRVIDTGRTTFSAMRTELSGLVCVSTPIDSNDDSHIIHEQVCENYIETVRAMQEETRVQYERDERERVRNEQARTREEIRYRQSGHTNQADDQANARQRIADDRERERRNYERQMSWYEKLLRFLKRGVQKIQDMTSAVLGWLSSLWTSNTESEILLEEQESSQL